MRVTSRQIRSLLVVALAAGSFAGCGGHSGNSIPPIVLSVSLSSPTISLTQGGAPVLVPVTIVAPTETATFVMQGLPGGVAYTYKESESNPSGQLTISASVATTPGTYPGTIVVGSSGQTASTAFSLVVAKAVKASISPSEIPPVPGLRERQPN